MISIKLFSVTTMLDSMITRGLRFENVELRWLYHGECRRQHMYADLIENYDPTDRLVGWPCGAVEELFTEDEAKLLKVYLDVVAPCSSLATIKEETMPISMDRMSYSGFPCRPGFSDFFDLSGSEHTFPFPIQCFFDVEDRIDAAYDARAVARAAGLTQADYLHGKVAAAAPTVTI